MPHFSYRTLLVAFAAPALSLILAACGSTAINANYTPGPSPNAGASMGTTPTKGATKTTKKPGKKTSTPHSTSTHSSTTSRTSGSTTTSHSTTPHKTATTPTRASGGGGGGTVTPTCAWQAGNPSVIVTPCTGLTSGQTVTIQGRGFKTGTRVLAVECLNNSTGPNSCNINILSPPPTKLPNADGTVAFTIKVLSHFGPNTCSSSTPCVVSIASTTGNPPSEDPSAPISFG